MNGKDITWLQAKDEKFGDSIEKNLFA